MENIQSEKKRIILLDEIRGLCVLFMVFFHGVYDIVYVFGYDLPWFRGFVMQEILQPLDAGLFIFLAGFATRYTRSNLKRGILTFGLGMVITLVTWRTMPSQLIIFGILHGLGLYMILFGLWEQLREYFTSKKTAPERKKIPPLVGLTIFMLLFAFVYEINWGSVGFFRLKLVDLPSVFYSTQLGFFLGFFPQTGFSTADYFPLLPWFFLFLAGSYFGRWTKEGRVPSFFYKSRCMPVAWIGRRSLVIYMLHQPILYGVLFVFFKLSSGL